MLKSFRVNFSKLFILTTVFAVAVACSDDDDPNPKSDLEEVQLSFAEQEAIIEIPQALVGSNNEYAAQIVSTLNSVNMMTSSLAMFTVPEGVEKSSDLITVSTGRTAARSGAVWYYHGEADGQQISMAYQVAEDGDKYTFEIFYKFSADSDWLLFLYAEEKKDRSAGHFAMYDVTSDDGHEMMRWAWTRKGDEVTVTLSEGGFVWVEVTSNTKTNAGELTMFMDAGKVYQIITWDGDGSGTWTQYDEAGAVVAEGFWEA